eukprot:scaffold22164_cov78-Skeletonema_dohrnii-CCMP3373.AAC.1
MHNAKVGGCALFMRGWRMEVDGGLIVDCGLWMSSLSIYLAPKQNFRAGFKMFELKRKGCWLLRTCYRCYLRGAARSVRSAKSKAVVGVVASNLLELLSTNATLLMFIP